MATRKKISKVLILKKNTEGFYLEGVEAFTFPTKIYGNLEEKADRVLKTFKERDKSLGVLFTGIKGNSKTTLAKMIAERSGKDIVLVTEPFTGSEFTHFISALNESVVFIDEFEKIYNTDELQQEFLSILDGTLSKKKLFLFTSNNERVNEFLRNRPSRIFYHFKHDNLEDEVLDDIIENELKEKEFEEELRAILTTLGSVSVDVLINLIDEINRFKISPKKLVKELNIMVEQTEFSVVMVINGKRFTTNVSFNPLTVEEHFIDYQDDGRFRFFRFIPQDYTLYTRGKSFVFEGENDKIIFSPYKPYKFEL